MRFIIVYGVIGILAVVTATAARAFYRRVVKPEVEHAIASLQRAVETLETVVANKGAEITDHLEEIALQQRHLDLKRADAARALRIRDKLTELLS